MLVMCKSKLTDVDLKKVATALDILRREKWQFENYGINDEGLQDVRLLLTGIDEPANEFPADPFYHRLHETCKTLPGAISELREYANSYSVHEEIVSMIAWLEWVYYQTLYDQ